MHPKAQPVVVLVLITSQKTGPQFKVSSDRLGEPVIKLHRYKANFNIIQFICILILMLYFRKFKSLDCNQQHPE